MVGALFDMKVHIFQYKIIKSKKVLERGRGGISGKLDKYALLNLYQVHFTLNSLLLVICVLI